eukprot:3796964-Pleurochrysis_carterae.AAC.4
MQTPMRASIRFGKPCSPRPDACGRHPRLGETAVNRSFAPLGFWMLCTFSSDRSSHSTTWRPSWECEPADQHVSARLESIIGLPFVAFWNMKQKAGPQWRSKEAL